MTVRRIVANIATTDLEGTREFYAAVFGLDVAMDHGWVVALASPEHARAQLQVFTHDATAPVVPALSIEVDDVDAVHDLVVRRGDPIVHPLSDEQWGVRRFFTRDPNGTVLNVLSHRT